MSSLGSADGVLPTVGSAPPAPSLDGEGIAEEAVYVVLAHHRFDGCVRTREDSQSSFSAQDGYVSAALAAAAG